VAVALEAVGRYDDALATYKKALAAAPKNQTLRRNYARFAEFFTSFARGVKPKGEPNATR
jgi:tetratricopeptide (TPR) repeat protein